MIIYLVTNTINGKQYIGQTTQNLAQRWAQHMRESRRLHLPLYTAIRKYGAKSFIVSVLDTAISQTDLNQKEKDFIEAYHTCDRSFGYNLHEGGNKPPLMNPETAIKVGLANLGKKRTGQALANIQAACKKAGPKMRASRMGHTTSPETREKIGAAHKGMKHTPESIEKIKLARAKQAPIKWSAESRAKFSLLVKSLKRTPPRRTKKPTL
jgi:group I intron endonuclease